MHSRVIGALGPLPIKKINRDALNISIFRIGPPKKSLNLVPFLHTKFRLIEISLGRLTFPCFPLNMVPFIKLLLGLIGIC